MAEGLSQQIDNSTGFIDISADIERYASLGILGTLLADRSTGGNIIWASNVFSDKGESYAPEDEIFIRDITGDNAGIIRTRASKDRDDQVALTRAHAEVFTPLWIVHKMVDWADEAWYESREASPLLWQQYVRSPRLEITCGEAPYLVSRYDAADGTPIPVDQRCGVLDRKLLEIGKHVRSRRSWMRHALAALKSTYGYEYQGDNLLIARVNVLATMEDYLDSAGWDSYTPEEYQQVAEVISWNLWQMDGLKNCVPNGALGVEETEMRLPGFDELFGLSGGQMEIGITRGRGSAKIYDWKNRREVEFQALKREVSLMGSGSQIQFDYIIGNPPYQSEPELGSTRALPLYDKFMEQAFLVSDKVELITPARFLFNSGQTSTAWNRKMLADPHFKVLYYEADSKRVFVGVDIKGGVAITYRDAKTDFGPIEMFIPDPMLRGIAEKAGARDLTESLTSISGTQCNYNFTELYADHPDYSQYISGGGRHSQLKSNALERVPIFTAEKQGKDDLRIYGLVSRERVFRWCPRRYIDPTNECLMKYKVVIPASNGSGTLGEVLSNPVVIGPGTGFTQTFMCIGRFATVEEAEALLKYIKTKLSRALLGVLKNTQHNPPVTWRMIPLQDFTRSSDIDWTQPIAGIDRQLYAKYGLTQDEIDFIESHVKEMQ